MTSEKEDQILCKRFQELARTAEYKYINTFTSFLTLNEVSLFYQNIKLMPTVKYSMFGGNEDSERKMICFHGEEHLIDSIPRTGNYNEIQLEQQQCWEIYPISCIRISPINQKFSDTFTHRDFLGAIMNLGIERNKIGDIILDQNEGYLFCEDKIGCYVIETLTKIKHTNVSCSKYEWTERKIEPKYQEITGTVTSVRLDAIISTAFQTSRSQMSGYIEGGKVYVNGRETLSNSYNVKENDIISVRGIGKFQYIGTSYQTKKGRYSVTVKRYI